MPAIVNDVFARRADYYARIDTKNLTPLWEVLHGLVTPEPVSAVRAAHWSYDAIRPAIMEGGEIITASEAERRVLVLENPGLRGKSSITQTLYAGLQLILPGEVASAHRHSQSALRFVLEGRNAYTAVDGERTMMSPGDFVITPSWTWHDHGNDSDQPMVWLDGLDIPLVTTLGVSFAQPGAEGQQRISRRTGDALQRYGQGLLPVDWQPGSLSSPIFNYPYERTREALQTLSKNGEPDACHGYKMRYINPVNGDYAMPTIGSFIQWIPVGFSTETYRCTDATVVVVVEGSGISKIGEETFRWQPHDVLVVPSWVKVSHHPYSEAVLFNFSDRPVQQKLGLWREDRGNA